MSFLRDLRVAFYSLQRTQGLAITVILTLALGIGANAAIFTLVRGVLLKPLVHRDEDRLIYIRQSAPGTGDENTAFSVPDIQDLRASVKTLSAFGDFSTTEFTMLGLGEPRQVQAGVVGGNYFEVMGLHPVPGRLIGPQTMAPMRQAPWFSPIVFGRPHSEKILPSSAKLFASIAVSLAVAPPVSSAS